MLRDICTHHWHNRSLQGYGDFRILRKIRILVIILKNVRFKVKTANEVRHHFNTVSYLRQRDVLCCNVIEHCFGESTERDQRGYLERTFNTSVQHFCLG